MNTTYTVKLTQKGPTLFVSVFSAKSGESYLSRKEWEEIKNMTEGEFKKTITETVFSDTTTERTIVYKAPFFKKCCEDDYREAWAMLEERKGVK
jgi:hypothetical protein